MWVIIAGNSYCFLDYYFIFPYLVTVNTYCASRWYIIAISIGLCSSCLAIYLTNAFNCCPITSLHWAWPNNTLLFLLLYWPVQWNFKMIDYFEVLICFIWLTNISEIIILYEYTVPIVWCNTYICLITLLVFDFTCSTEFPWE